MTTPWNRVQSIKEEDEDYDPTSDDGDESEESACNKDGPAQTSAHDRRKRGRSREVVAESCPHHKSARSAGVVARAWERRTTTDSKALKSKVWLDFTNISKDDAGETVAECNICHKVLRAASKNFTSHLRRHLTSVHPHNENEVHKYSLKSEENDDGSHALRNYKFDQELRDRICIFLVRGSHPSTVVEEQGFRLMMSIACPQFKNVSRHTIRRDILAMFERERTDLLEYIINCPGKVSFSADNWKSDITNFSFICITCHYVDAAWKLNKRIIWFKRLNPPYDGAYIADEVHLCFREWKLDTKIMCLTLDNAPYNDKMVDSLKTCLLPKCALPLFGTFFKVGCYAHILNMVVQAGLKLVDISVQKLRDGIQYIKASSYRRLDFYNAAETMYKLNVTKKMKADMPDRWNSTYKMLENGMYFKDALLWLAERDSIFKTNFWLSFDEWEKLGMMHSFLKKFYDVTCILSETKYLTSSLYLKCVYMVHTHLLEAHSARENFITPLVLEVRQKFDRYWSDYSIILSCAAVLDPRYKMDFVRFCYTKLYAPEDAERRIHEVGTTLQSLLEEYRGSSVNQTSSDVAPNTCGTEDFMSDFRKYLLTCPRKSQLELYLEAPCRDFDEDLDVLEFWSKSSMQYPELAPMARDVLAIPMSTVASKSLFSMGGKVITPDRGSLKPKIIEAFMCLEDWYQGKMQEQEGPCSTSGSESSMQLLMMKYLRILNKKFRWHHSSIEMLSWKIGDGIMETAFYMDDEMMHVSFFPIVLL